MEWRNENENEAKPEYSFEEVVVGGFLVLSLLSHHLLYCTRREWRPLASGDMGS